MRYFLTFFLLFLCACQPVSNNDTNFRVDYHPDGGLYVGDQVSIEVIPPEDWKEKEQKVRVSVGEQVLGTADFSPSGVGQREQATLWWVWETEDLPAGEHVLSYVILPDGPSWDEKIQLLPSEKRPYPTAIWTTTTTDCCTLAYISGTAAERDIENLTKMVDEHAENVSEIMQTDINESINITFIPRLLGHGGFVSNGIYVTYIDNNITGNITNQVIHHEMVHVFDRSLSGKFRPSILVEGLAVYLSGGHFKTEALMPRAAALLELDTYIPLKILAEDFYYQQHEIGYLEAGALVEFMVGKYGWDVYQTFYRDIDSVGNQIESLEEGLKRHFAINLDQLETDFINELKSQKVTDTDLADLQLTVAFYDSLRHYQEVLDPSAYFLTAWFPDGEAMRQRNITADLLRTPNQLDNHLFEFLLRSASKNIAAGEHKKAEVIMDLVNILLSLYPQSWVQN